MSNTSVDRPVSSPLAELSAKLSAKAGEFTKLLPETMPAERFLKVFLAEAVRNPNLTTCDFLSVYTSLCTAAQLGLMVGSVLGECYLIPYGGTCQAIVGYKGMTKMARRAGVIVRAELIYQDEEFFYDRGTGEIRHPWAIVIDRSHAKIIGAYAIAELTQHPGMRPIVVVLTRADIEHHRKFSKARENGPWKDHYDMMARKTAIRALMMGGLVPLESEMAEQLTSEEEIKQAEVVPPERAKGMAGLAVRLSGSEPPAPTAQEPLPPGTVP